MHRMKYFYGFGNNKSKKSAFSFFPTHPRDFIKGWVSERDLIPKLWLKEMKNF